MAQRPTKRKGGNSSVKYPPKLGRRRELTGDQQLRNFLSRKRTEAERRLTEYAEPLINADYYDEGLRWIARYLKINAPFHGIRETGGIFWYELAIKLLQRHVGYFMPPARRGRPPKLRAHFPLLEQWIAQIKTGDMGPALRDAEQFADAMRHTAQILGLSPPELPPITPPKLTGWTVDRAYEEVAKLCNCAPETVRREFNRWRALGGNSTD